MLFERFESPGLAHYSYLIGSRNQAIVIDPRRDCDVYVERAGREGLQISHVLETHRNEDYVIGSLELVRRTGATVLHSGHNDPGYGYGESIRDGDTLPLGQLKVEAVFTPGHTPGHMSYLLYDPDGAPWVVFSGDALFAGDVGRMDLFGPDRLEEMAGLLYDSLFGRLLPLGDEVIVCPAHGAGSVCGSEISERTWTTIGLERKRNPKLQYTDKAGFLAHVPEILEYPPYFRMMEKLNLEGPPVLCRLPEPAALPPREFAAGAGGGQVLDTRMVMGFGSAHVPDALSMWEDGVPSFAGWFLSYDRPILLLSASNDPSEVVRYLVRMGFDRVDAFLAGGMLAWLKAGLPSRRVETVTVQELCQRLDRGEDTWILDVRRASELEEEGEIPRAHHVHITQLPQHLDEVPAGRRLFVFCGTGLRSMIAASLLQRAGRADVAVVLGGFAGWSSLSCPIRRERRVLQPQPGS